MRTDSEGDCSTNVTVIYRHRFFLLDVYHPADKTLLNISEIYDKINKLMIDNSSREYGVGLGALTSDHRDTWADVRLFR